MAATKLFLGVAGTLDPTYQIADVAGDIADVWRSPELLRNKEFVRNSQLKMFSLAGAAGIVAAMAERAALAGEEAGISTTAAAPRGSMFNSGLRTTEPASESLLRAVERQGRTINYALPGSEELRYLDYMRANANVGGPKMTDILLRQNPTKVEVLEEFLHGTQYRIGVIDKLSVQGAEIHVKEFMLRHQRLLGVSPEDAKILQQMLRR